MINKIKEQLNKKREINRIFYYLLIINLGIDIGKNFIITFIK